jgi:hypothetical protein
MPLKLDLDDLDQIARIHAPHLIAPPGLAPAAPQIAGPGLAPETLPVGAPPTQIQKPTRQESNAAGTSEFRAGKPTVTETPNSPGYFRQQAAQQDYEKAHPWGSPISEHPGFLGKVAHGLAKAGNIAGDIFAPGTMALIPHTDLNNQLVHANTLSRQSEAEQRETQQQKADTEQEGVEQKPEIAEATGEARGRLESQKESDQDKRLQQTLESQETRAASRDSEADKKQSAQFGEQEKLEGMRETAAEKRARIAAEKESGSYMPLYDEKGHVTGAWNPKTGHVNKSPDALPGTTSQGQTIANKGAEQQAKALKPYQDVLDAREEAHNLAKMADAGNAEADVNLALSYFKVMKGAAGSGVRFTQQESNLIMKSREMGQDLEAVGQKVIGSGQPFTPDQRKKVVQVIDMHAEAAQNAINRLSQGGGGAPAGGGDSQGIQVIRDANGRIVGVK